MNYTQIHVREYTKETNTDTQRGYIRRRYTESDICKRIYKRNKTDAQRGYNYDELYYSDTWRKTYKIKPKEDI